MITLIFPISIITQLSPSYSPSPIEHTSDRLLCFKNRLDGDGESDDRVKDFTGDNDPGWKS